MPDPYDQKNQQRVLDLVAMMRPLSMRRNHKVRVGNDWDGGYVVPDAALRADAVICIGVGLDVSFEYALAQLGAQVILFDHTVEKLPVEHPAFRYFKKGWGPRTENEFLNLTDITAQLEGKPLHPLLKFDIEGGEYDIFAGMHPDELLPFEVICCELHDFRFLADEKFFAGLHHLLATLNRHHAPVHLHACNYSGFVVIEGVAFPETVEFTFLRRDLDPFAGYSHEPMPGPLDRPCHPYKADLCFNPF